MKQDELITAILSDNSNMKLCGASPQLWYQWQTRHKADNLTDEKQQGILLAMGYEIGKERTWKKKK